VKQHSIVVAVVVVAGFLSLAMPARAHEVRPAYLELIEHAPGRFDVIWKVPTLSGPPAAPELLRDAAVRPPRPATPAEVKTFPCGCPVPPSFTWTQGTLPVHPTLAAHARQLTPIVTERLETSQIQRWSIDVGERGLNGSTLAIHNLPSTTIDALVRVSFADGRVLSHVLRPSSPSMVIDPAGAGPRASGYLLLGVEHILLGVDHLLFVLGLLLLVRGGWRIVKTVTAFTVAHSVTLSLAALGYVHVPSAPVEAVIALSIAFVAVAVVKRREGAAPSLAERQPWLVAFLFGLLHGLGFAGGLSEVGLPPRDVPLALLLFSAGVELGHFAFIGVVMGVAWLGRRLWSALPGGVRLLPGYGIGAVASYWLIARIAVFW
jgi:hydrogenase/urease accessory protein HupE